MERGQCICIGERFLLYSVKSNWRKVLLVVTELEDGNVIGTILCYRNMKWGHAHENVNIIVYKHNLPFCWHNWTLYNFNSSLTKCSWISKTTHDKRTFVTLEFQHMNTVFIRKLCKPLFLQKTTLSKNMYFELRPLKIVQKPSFWAIFVKIVKATYYL